MCVFLGHRRHAARSCDLCNMHVFDGMSVQRLLASSPPDLATMQTSKLSPLRNEIDVSVVSCWERNAPRRFAKHRYLTPCAPLVWPRLSHFLRIQVSLRIKRGACTTLGKSDGSPPLPVEETFCFPLSPRRSMASTRAFSPPGANFVAVDELVAIRRRARR